MLKPAFEVRCFKKDHLSSRRKRGNLTGIHWIWRRVWMRITCFELLWVSKKFTSKTRGRGGDEVIKPVVEVRLTTDSGVARRLPSRHCRLTCLPRQLPLFSMSLWGLLSMYFCFLQMRICRYCWIRFVSPDSFPLATRQALKQTFD